MMRLATLIAAMLSFGMASVGVAQAQSAPLPALLPTPVSVTQRAGSFDIRGAAIAASTLAERAAAERLRDLVARSGGPALSFQSGGAIRFRHDAAIKGAEAYRLIVTPMGVTISASGDAGLYYGAETLWQLIAASDDGRIAATVIEDRPAFQWRGVMLDSVRHFQPVAYVKQLIDCMAMAKLNTLHWHLSDDQGWRIEIDRYPRLTSVGAWRQEAGAAGFDPATGKPVPYGGYYTKAQIRAVVAYASAHHVRIVPEIDMPGHATALVAAYPDLASIADPPKQPSNKWGILPNLLNPDQHTIRFVENVLDEVMALFPGRYIHVGGDEAVKDQWKHNPAIQAQMKALGLKDENALQGWFTAQLGDYLAKHGRNLIGWDEILEGQVPADATVMSWRGVDGAITAAKAGHDTVLSPAPILYMDNRQSDSAREPSGRGEIVSWKRLYGFDPSPAALTPDQRQHILGLQVNLWTEHVRTTAYADRMLWPRAAILAELAWSNPKKDWEAFAPSLIAAMTRWRRMGLGYDRTPLDPEADFAGGDGAIDVTLRQPAEIGTIRYTTIGATPSSQSPAYDKPLTLSPGTELVAQAFDGDAPLGSPQRWLVGPERLFSRTAVAMELCTHSIPLRIEDDGPTDGVRAIHWVDVMHPCWIWRGAPLDRVKTITAEVGRLPYNFAIGDAIKQVVFDPPKTPAGEMVVRQDSCTGPVVADIPLEPATHTTGVAQVTGAIQPLTGAHDLCVTFTQNGPDPYWVLDRLTLHP